MNKLILGLVLLLFFWFALAASMWSMWYISPVSQDTSSGILSESWDHSEEEISFKQDEIITDEVQNTNFEGREIVRQKIEKIKWELADKGLIIEGDSYYQNNLPILALQNYLDYYKKHPDNQLIIEKIGNTYYSMHKFEQAWNYYTQSEKLSQEARTRAALSRINMSSQLSLGDQKNILKDIEALQLWNEEIFYYSNSFACIQDFHACKVAFEEYFWPQEAYDSDGNQIQERALRFSALQDIKNSIINYRNFGLDEVSMKDAYIISSWYQNGLFPLAIRMSQISLLQTPDYKPLLKIIAQSYYEMWEYTTAMTKLSEFNEKYPEDGAVSYSLGLVSQKIKDYVLANVHFQNALKYNYAPSIDVRRQIIYTYYALEKDDLMLKAFWEMIENESQNITPEDLGLAIYNAILQEDYTKALEWAQFGQKRFPSNSNFYAYEGWIYRQGDQYENALSALKKGQEIDAENPFLLLNFAYLELAQENTIAAKIYFHNVIKNAPESEFAQQAQKEIDELENTVKS